MNHPVTFDAALTTSQPERKAKPGFLALWLFIFVVAIVAVVALISENQFTLDQRLEAFIQTGIYP